MNTVRISEVNEAVRTWLQQVLGGEGVVIEDESGRRRGSFVPYVDPKPEQERQADASLERLWEKTGQAMRQAGVTEEDIDRDLQEDD